MTMRWFRLILRIVLLVVVIGGGVWGTRTILDQKTEAQDGLLPGNPSDR